MSESDDDLFENTQNPPPPPPVCKDGKLQYTSFIVFKWGGDVFCPFEIVGVSELDKDVHPSWTSGVLSPKSRAKYRQLMYFPDYAVSMFSKIEKSMVSFFYIYF